MLASSYFSNRALAAFIRERLAEDQRRIDGTTPGVWKIWGGTVMADQDGTGNADTAVEVATPVATSVMGEPLRMGNAYYLVQFRPTRMATEVAAHAAIADALAMSLGDEPSASWEGLQIAACHIAAIWSEHPDYDREWTP